MKTSVRPYTRKIILYDDNPFVRTPVRATRGSICPPKLSRCGIGDDLIDRRPFFMPEGKSRDNRIKDFPVMRESQSQLSAEAAAPPTFLFQLK